jgi:hypothetical protein
MVAQASCSVIAHSEIRFRRLVARVHALGSWVVTELLVELGAAHLIRTAIERKLERYARPDPEVLRVTGADRFPRPLVHLVVGEDRT